MNGTHHAPHTTTDNNHSLPYKRALIAAACLALMPWAAAQSDRSVDLPERLAEMGAEILTVDREPYGHEILLALPDGTVIDLDVDRNGMWLEATASAGETFSTDVLDRLLPNAVLQHPALERLQSATEVERYSWGFEVTGFDANGQPVESEFAADGNRL